MERSEAYRDRLVANLQTCRREDAAEMARLREALQAIATTDPVDAALDPDRARRIARSALSPESNPEGQ